ncbi:MAG: Ppx/GppA family phosphatase, partial [Alphaproteobacteria bacterium]|nr:Ppx/GppA family phosphatase [Alphaproteobacteria bacterium]
LSGKDEAVLSFLGCSPLLDLGTRNAVVVDVGGGSTDCTVVNMLDAMQPRIRTWVSIPHGMLTLSERFGVHDLTHAGYEDMVAFVTGILAEHEKEHGIGALVKEGGFQMLCSSGTVTTIGAIHHGLERYNRAVVDGTHMPLSAVHTLTRELIDMGYDGRRRHSCIGRDRADFILAGCAIVEAAGKVWPVDEITIADRGVREGIILSLFRKAS